MDFYSLVDKFIASLTDTTKCFRELLDGTPIDYRVKIEEMHRSSMQKRVEYAEALIEMKIQHREVSKCLEECYKNCTSFKGFKIDFEKRKAALLKQKTNVKELAEFKQVKKAIEEAAKLYIPPTNGDGKNYAEFVYSIFDPWTMEVMLNPVRNKKCGHVYQRESVMRILGDSVSTRCPIEGCTNKSFLHPDILIKDEDFRQKVLRELEMDDEMIELVEVDEEDSE
ncbi:E3 SUMO-protein ligase NSE2-like [Drosophila bipectinata]|uniref:E3 SUMO-protein ligase NSE2-like n=1 Tax=Drosophila bipectinata TaxID=42026 RepID=UPI001C891F4B|nr:E3 SUMO-protein ligase NSE2-like [Drosophila bipectinata]